jgi:hypothetical protein
VLEKDGMFISLKSTALPIELEEFAQLIEQEIAE